jgi:glycosyltransferase involved in cell wall biosynthesis
MTENSESSRSEIRRPRISVVIPALDEERSLPLVLAGLPWSLLTEVVVADNGSTDATASVAEAGGARVTKASRRGYGSACLAGIAALQPTDIVVFMDADYSDHPEQLERVVAPILAGKADLVIGSRALGPCEPGAMLPQQRFGNWLATRLIRWVYGHRYTDLGPFRAITWTALSRLRMADPDFGWTVEMQIRALQERLAVTEVPVSYRRRVGVSKIAGTVAGTISAGRKIIGTIFVLRWRYGPSKAPVGRDQRPFNDQS